MYGAIIGDLAGSIYEYDQTKEIKSIDIDEIIEDNAFYSDDTILTIAIAEAILNNCDYDKYLRKYVRLYSEYRPDFEPYFKNPFSPGLMKWAMGNSAGTSVGNGAMMRISPVGYLFNTEIECNNDTLREKKIDFVTALNLLNPKIYNYDLEYFRISLFNLSQNDLKNFDFSSSDNVEYITYIKSVIGVEKIKKFWDNDFLVDASMGIYDGMSISYFNYNHNLLGFK